MLSLITSSTSHLTWVQLSRSWNWKLGESETWNRRITWFTCSSNFGGYSNRRVHVYPYWSKWPIWFVADYCRCSSCVCIVVDAKRIRLEILWNAKPKSKYMLNYISKGVTLSAVSYCIMLDQLHLMSTLLKCCSTNLWSWWISFR